MSSMNDRIQEDLKEQIKDLRDLQQVADDEAFGTYFDKQLSIVADKMVWGFSTSTRKTVTGKKTVDNIQNWDDFCKWRGEIIARLQPVQEVYGAESMVKYLTDQLESYYKQKL